MGEWHAGNGSDLVSDSKFESESESVMQAPWTLEAIHQLYSTEPLLKYFNDSWRLSQVADKQRNGRGDVLPAEDIADRLQKVLRGITKVKHSPYSNDEREFLRKLTGQDFDTPVDAARYAYGLIQGMRREYNKKLSVAAAGYTLPRDITRKRLEVLGSMFDDEDSYARQRWDAFIEQLSHLPGVYHEVLQVVRSNQDSNAVYWLLHLTEPDDRFVGVELDVTSEDVAKFVTVLDDAFALLEAMDISMDEDASKELRQEVSIHDSLRVGRNEIRFIDRDGNFVNDQVYSFLMDDGLYPVVAQGDAWFHVDRQGRALYDHRFDLVRRFLDDVAPAKRDGKWFLIDITGQQISPVFENVHVKQVWQGGRLVTERNLRAQIGGRWCVLNESYEVIDLDHEYYALLEDYQDQVDENDELELERKVERLNSHVLHISDELHKRGFYVSWEREGVYSFYFLKNDDVQIEVFEDAYGNWGTSDLVLAQREGKWFSVKLSSGEIDGVPWDEVRGKGVASVRQLVFARRGESWFRVSLSDGKAVALGCEGYRELNWMQHVLTFDDGLQLLDEGLQPLHEGYFERIEDIVLPISNEHFVVGKSNDVWQVLVHKNQELVGMVRDDLWELYRALHDDVKSLYRAAPLMLDDNDFEDPEDWDDVYDEDYDPQDYVEIDQAERYADKIGVITLAGQVYLYDSHRNVLHQHYYDGFELFNELEKLGSYGGTTGMFLKHETQYGVSWLKVMFDTDREKEVVDGVRGQSFVLYNEAGGDSWEYRYAWIQRDGMWEISGLEGYSPQFEDVKLFENMVFGKTAEGWELHEVRPRAAELRFIERFHDVRMVENDDYCLVKRASGWHIMILDQDSKMLRWLDASEFLGDTYFVDKERLRVQLRVSSFEALRSSFSQHAFEDVIMRVDYFFVVQVNDGYQLYDMSMRDFVSQHVFDELVSLYNFGCLVRIGGELKFIDCKGGLLDFVDLL